MKYVIDNDLESWVIEIDRCVNYPENLQQQKKDNMFFADIQCQKFGRLII